MTETAQETENTPIWRLKEVRIEKLFGYYDHIIPLNLEKRVTVLHGRNGVGKTAVLRLIEHVVNENPSSNPYPKPAKHRFLWAKWDGTVQEQAERYPPAVMIGIDRLDNNWRGRRGVVGAGEDVSRVIRQIDWQYSQTATKLDAEFPAKMFQISQREWDSAEKVALSQRWEVIQEQRKRLQHVGLLLERTNENTNTFTPILQQEQTDNSKLSVFALYLDHEQQKLQVFQELLAKAEIFVRIINEKFAQKHVKLDSSDGYIVTNEIGEKVPLDGLSSGEQHELLLLHKLLFEIKPNTLVLIDEPELSMHVVWQRDFLDDLLDIAQLVKIDVIVATHSPYIVGDHTDLLVQLGEPVGGPA